MQRTPGPPRTNADVALSEVEDDGKQPQRRGAWAPDHEILTAPGFDFIEYLI